MKRALFFIPIILIVVVAVIYLWQYQIQPKEITFAQCKELGGITWRVDSLHPDICPSCSNYYNCFNKYGDYTGICSDCGVPCTTCQENKRQLLRENYDQNFMSNPSGYEIKHSNLIEEMQKCPPCLSCQQCKDKKYEELMKECPSMSPECSKCIGDNGPYSQKCPSGMKKIGEISDAATYFQCCK